MILLTYDTSDSSLVAFDAAVELAKNTRLPLRLMLVVDGALRHQFSEEARAQTREMGVQRSAEDAISDALNIRREQLEAQLGAPVEAGYRHATDAGVAILQAAEEFGARYIVMATHGRTGLMRFITGSVTEHVIRNANIPVLVVPVRSKLTAG